jgi:serine/threonine protein kinase
MRYRHPGLRMDEASSTPAESAPSKAQGPELIEDELTSRGEPGAPTAGFGRHSSESEGSPHTSAGAEPSAANAQGQAAPLAPADRIGKIIAGRYQIIELLGEGGMGAVYRGVHVTLQKRVAVKFLHPELSRSTEVVSRFQREAVAAANLEHPNVVAAHDFGRDESGAFFLVMDFIDGATLGALLDERTRLEPSEVLHIARHVGAALARAHEMDIVHRDLKPDNIVLVQRDGDPLFAKVIDFGIAKVSGRMGSGQTLTQVGMVFGTPEYMAPEQALGAEVDRRADLYALGVLLFECLTGRRPYVSDDVVGLLGMQMSSPIPKLAEVAPELSLAPALDDFFAKALAKKPSDRFSSAAAMVESLSLAIGEPFLGLGPSATGRNSALSVTGRHAVASVPSAVSQTNAPVSAPSLTNASAPSTGAPTSPIEPVEPTATTHATAESNTRPPTITPLSEIARESLVVIPRAAAETLAGATRDAWKDLAKDHQRRRSAYGIGGAFALFSLVFALAEGRAVSNARDARRARTDLNAATPDVNPISARDPGPTIGHRAPEPTTVPVANNPANIPSNIPANNANTPSPANAPLAATSDVAADLAAFRAQPAIHVLLDPRGALPLRSRIDALEQLRASGNDSPLMAYTLGTLYARQGPRGRTRMLDRYTAAVAARRELATEPQLLDDVINAAQVGRGSDGARERPASRPAPRVGPCADRREAAGGQDQARPRARHRALVRGIRDEHRRDGAANHRGVSRAHLPAAALRGRRPRIERRRAGRSCARGHPTRASTVWMERDLQPLPPRLGRTRAVCGPRAPPCRCAVTSRRPLLREGNRVAPQNQQFNGGGA